jgi:hypothetical protein
MQGREGVIQRLRAAGVTITLSEDSLLDKDSPLAHLPTEQQIVDLYGPHPVIQGLDTCATFRNQVPAVERMLGAAGLFSTGTNLVTQLLKQNCAIPERVAHYGPHASKEEYGMRWQV